jgi:hypothetical protein
MPLYAGAACREAWRPKGLLRKAKPLGLSKWIFFW